MEDLQARKFPPFRTYGTPGTTVSPFRSNWIWRRGLEVSEALSTFTGNLTLFNGKRVEPLPICIAAPDSKGLSPHDVTKSNVMEVISQDIVDPIHIEVVFVPAPACQRCSSTRPIQAAHGQPPEGLFRGL